MTVTRHDSNDALLVWHGAILSWYSTDGIVHEQRHNDCESPITHRTLGGVCDNISLYRMSVTRYRDESTYAPETVD